MYVRQSLFITFIAASPPGMVFRCCADSRNLCCGDYGNAAGRVTDTGCGRVPGATGVCQPDANHTSPGRCALFPPDYSVHRPPEPPLFADDTDAVINGGQYLCGNSHPLLCSGRGQDYCRAEYRRDLGNRRRNSCQAGRFTACGTCHFSDICRCCRRICAGNSRRGDPR